jgi:hypothetical protein
MGIEGGKIFIHGRLMLSYLCLVATLYGYIISLSLSLYLYILTYSLAACVCNKRLKILMLALKRM